MPTDAAGGSDAGRRKALVGVRVCAAGRLYACLAASGVCFTLLDVARTKALWVHE